MTSTITKGTVVIGGGSGFIGTALSKQLSSNGYNVKIISRKPKLSSMTWEDLSKHGLPDNCSAVVNLAGQNVLDPTRRWTAGFKQNVYASRINTTKALSKVISQMKNKPKVFASISGVGFYKASEIEEYTEDSKGGNHDYFSKLCTEWEASNNVPNDVRKVIVRSGIVIGKGGGMIKQLYWPFYFGLGGKIASGNQFMPWIHIEDIAGIFMYAIQSEKVVGILNGVAPQAITNSEFTQTFARAMNRPAFIPLPNIAINLAFGSERGAMMSEGQNVTPKKTLECGYKFQFPDIESAVKAAVK